jgi:hypothetical protein
MHGTGRFLPATGVSGPSSALSCATTSSAAAWLRDVSSTLSPPARTPHDAQTHSENTTGGHMHPRPPRWQLSHSNHTQTCCNTYH